MSGQNPILGFLSASFGFRSAQNLAAWAVAGGIAYYAWILPQQQAAAARQAIVDEWQQKYRENPNVLPIDKPKKV